jgi:nucleoside-triphosphatase THEP1
MDMNLSEKNALSFPDSENGNILVITGWRGVGKTTYCRKLFERYRKTGLNVSGLLSPGRFDNNQKNGFFAVDLSTSETRLAASSVPGELDGIQLGPWTFDATVFAWGNRCLQQAIGADVWVIDELGYLEFDMKTGWMKSFEVLRSKNYRLAIVVIRPECIDTFSQMGFSFQIKELHSLQVAG